MNKKNYISFSFISLLVSLILISSAFAPPTKGPGVTNFRIKTLFIDPGHGGSDPGCHGVFSKEADVALKISMRFGDMVKKAYPNINVVYARTDDRFVELYQRAVMANKANADLFICIHCNASKNRSAFGTETYSMGLHRTEDNLAVAQRENSVILLENDYQNHYEGFDPNDVTSYIMFSMLQNANLDQSVSLASKIQDEFETAGRFNRGVHQAGFAVLVHTSMPSVLVETGFLTNPTEETYMNSEDGLNELATSIFNGFVSYKNDVEGKKDIGKSGPSSKQEVKAPALYMTADKTETGDYYKVQFYSGSNPIDINDSRINKVDNFNIEKTANGNFRYLTKQVITNNEALQLQNSLRLAGFKDAFIVPFKNGRRLPTNNINDN